MEGISSSDLGTFLKEKVNLDSVLVARIREQVSYLRETLEHHVADHPDFALLKLIHFGSLAKGTAVAGKREADLAAYLRPDAEQDKNKALKDVLEELRDLLIGAYPQMEAAQFKIDPPAVTIAFSASRLRVDVVPVIPNGKPRDRGLLALRAAGAREWVETSIPLHLEFIEKRKKKHALFRDLVRLTKAWRNEKELPISSFELELIWCHLMETSLVPSDYQEAMLLFFAYFARTQLRERIVFADNYSRSEVGACADPVQIFDPVNASNNAASQMTDADRDFILREAEQALDAVAAGSTSFSKGGGIAMYRKVFGNTFSV